MDRDSVTAQLEIIFERFPKESIDSLQFVELILEIENFFNVELPVDMLDFNLYESKNELALYIFKQLWILETI